MSVLPKALEDAMAALGALPGVGPRSAERFAYYLLRADRAKSHQIAKTLQAMHENIRYCPRTFAFIDASEKISPLYTDPVRDKAVVAVVEDPFDIVALERTGQFKGTYHVLGGMISPIDNIGPEKLHVRELLLRIDEDKVSEIILATNASVEGESTALYLQQEIGDRDVKITRLARGLPIGLDLEYADQITLSRALEETSILMSSEESIQSIINSSTSIVVVQADNPDADSLASSLALENILGDLGKEVFMYCGSEVPRYLRYMEGWDRVQNELPIRFDAGIIVDASAIILLEQLQKTGAINWLKAKPCIVLDHHTEGDPTVDFATVMHIKDAVSTGEIIYELSQSLGWKRNTAANNMITTAILADSLGLTSVATGARSIAIVSELVTQGVKIYELEDKRRAMHKKSPALLAYKSQLLGRVEYSDDPRIATITIPWEEIEKYSHEYNPSVLVLDEMRMVHGVGIAIAFKTYPNGRITAKLRANNGSGVAADLAAHFGGGGHPCAAGFKITDGRAFNDVKSECIRTASKLLDTLKDKQDKEDETTQYAHQIS